MAGKARRRATRDAAAATQPQRQGIRRERRQAGREYRGGRRANKAAYGALDRRLGDIGSDYSKDYQKLGTQFGASMLPLSGMAGFGSGAESVAGLGQMGSIRQSGMAGLAGQRQRGVESTRSARTQGGIEQKTNSMNMLADFQNRLEELRQQASDLDAQESSMISTLTPQYRQQQFENNQVRNAVAEEDEFRKWLIEEMRRQMQGNRNAGAGSGGGVPPQPGWGWEGASPMTPPLQPQPRSGR